MTLTEKSGHLAWCALTALALARQDDGALSPAQESLFLTRWLATALKQRRFSRDVAPDIEWFDERDVETGFMVRTVRHRQSKEAATDMPHLKNYCATSRLYPFSKRTPICAGGSMERKLTPVWNIIFPGVLH